MFGFVSIAQLTQDIRAQLHRLPRDIELVVGIPRSGMIPAYTIGLALNLPVADVHAFVANKPVHNGATRPVRRQLGSTHEASNILLVDDSVTTGKSLRRAVTAIREAGYAGTITTCAGIVTPKTRDVVDIWFREMPHPRVFEWNALHQGIVEESCFDMDGVLCVDPLPSQNDDGERYVEFIRTARPLVIPTQRIAHIVSARLEKYRGVTEAWLRDHGVSYGRLHLIDLPSAAERIRLGAHSVHKARIYRETGTSLFIESDPKQAREIAALSGRPVLCFGNMKLYEPGMASTRAAPQRLRWILKFPVGRVRGWMAAARRIVSS